MTKRTERYAEEIFPSDYASWRYCIEVKCGEPLTPQFIESRISILSDPKQEETKRFAKLYGEPYLQQVLSWFQQAAVKA